MGRGHHEGSTGCEALNSEWPQRACMMRCRCDPGDLAADSAWGVEVEWVI